MWQFVFPNAVVRYREMRLSDLLQEEEGLTIHRTDCVNMINLTEAERARLIPAEWEGNKGSEETGGQYLAEIQDVCKDQQWTSDEYFQSIYGDGDGCQILNIRTSKQGMRP